MQYTGKCPKCGAKENHEYKNTPVWIKTENDVATNYCLECTQYRLDQMTIV